MADETPWAAPPGLVAALCAARHVAVLTGAGISAESGIPTFRDAQTGLWAQYRPKDLATPAAFRANPRLVWEWNAWRRGLIAAAQPNAGHRALVTLAERVPRLTLLTQNVDGLHARAGSPAVVELHGNLLRTKCFAAHHPVETWPETGEVPPRCPRCGSPLRPDVVWFGEALPPAALAAAGEAVHSCDVFLAVGTSLTVEPAASLPFMALDAGATVAIVSLDVLDQVDGQLHTIRGQAGTVLPALLRAAWPEGDAEVSPG